MSRIGGVGAVLFGFVALAAMRASAPHYVDITGPIPVAGKPGTIVRADNLEVDTGQPRVARAIRYRAAGQVETRESSGLWLVVPVTSRVVRKTAHVLGRVWEAADGRRYAASARVEDGDAMLSTTKTVQPGLERHDLIVFELPAALASGGTLLLSEDADPQLGARARIRYPAAKALPREPMIDLDAWHDKL